MGSLKRFTAKETETPVKVRTNRPQGNGSLFRLTSGWRAGVAVYADHTRYVKNSLLVVAIAIHDMRFPKEFPLVKLSELFK